ncbi:hypothetical protein NCH01_24090 [Neoasaia chiangmaiensis]|nr:hypothetical protein NCH01_24090 [Neoasaia chiangmaiensis]
MGVEQKTLILRENEEIGEVSALWCQKTCPHGVLGRGTRHIVRDQSLEESDAITTGYGQNSSFGQLARRHGGSPVMIGVARFEQACLARRCKLGALLLLEGMTKRIKGDNL